MKIKKINRTENRKGILMPEAMKIIIAVLCILLLLYLAYKLYSSMVGVTPMKQAEANLESIANIANGLSEEGQSDEFLLLSPSNWMLIGWPYEDLLPVKQFLMPKKCSDNSWKNCICLCPFSSTDYDIEKGLETIRLSPESALSWCDDGGICKEIKHKEVIVSSSEGLGTVSYALWKIIAFTRGASPKSPILIENQLIDAKRPLKIELREDDAVWIFPKSD